VVRSPRSSSGGTRLGWRSLLASLCGSVSKDFVYHACGQEFESRPKWKFSNFPHHLWLLLSDNRSMAKWFGAHFTIRRSALVLPSNVILEPIFRQYGRCYCTIYIIPNNRRYLYGKNIHQAESTNKQVTEEQRFPDKENKSKSLSEERKFDWKSHQCLRHWETAISRAICDQSFRFPITGKKFQRRKSSIEERPVLPWITQVACHAPIAYCCKRF